MNSYIITLSRPLPLSARLSNINCAFEFPLLLYCNISEYTDGSAVFKFFVGASKCTGLASLSDTLSKLLGMSEIKLKELRMTGINLREVGIYNTIKLNKINNILTVNGCLYLFITITMITPIPCWNILMLPQVCQLTLKFTC